MITNKDRSGWFGASDANFITGNYNTKTFKKWWLEKLGIHQSTINTKPMRAGTHFEHKILDTIPNVIKDRQIIIPELKLRVNLDGETDIIHEVKTHKIDKPYKPTKSHKQQVIVQMYASGKEAEILSYGLTENDYKNYFAEIDIDRIKHHEIEYDEKYIALFLDRIKYLCKCLEKGEMPKNEEY
jgi:hypothetical protein